MQTFSPLALGGKVPAGTNFICLSGVVRRAEPIGIIQRGDFRLIGADGRIIAALRSGIVDLNPLVGRFVTVCGLDEGVIEGVRSILVTNVLGTQVSPFPPARFDLRTLLLLSLLGRGISPNLLLLLLLTGQLGPLAGLGGGLAGPGKLGKGAGLGTLGKGADLGKLGKGAGLGTLGKGADLGKLGKGAGLGTLGKGAGLGTLGKGAGLGTLGKGAGLGTLGKGAGLTGTTTTTGV